MTCVGGSKEPPTQVTILNELIKRKWLRIEAASYIKWHNKKKYYNTVQHSIHYDNCLKHTVVYRIMYAKKIINFAYLSGKGRYLLH